MACYLIRLRSQLSRSATLSVSTEILAATGGDYLSARRARLAEQAAIDAATKPVVRLAGDQVTRYQSGPETGGMRSVTK
jgi:hypothetical protein